MRPSSPRVMRESSTRGVFPIAPSTESSKVSSRKLATGASFLVSMKTSRKLRSYTGCQHSLGLAQPLGKIANRIDIGITETFGFLPNELTPEWYVLRNLAAHGLGQTAI